MAGGQAGSHDCADPRMKPKDPVTHYYHAHQEHASSCQRKVQRQVPQQVSGCKYARSHEGLSLSPAVSMPLAQPRLLRPAVDCSFSWQESIVRAFAAHAWSLCIERTAGSRARGYAFKFMILCLHDASDYDAGSPYDLPHFGSSKFNFHVAILGMRLRPLRENAQPHHASDHLRPAGCPAHRRLRVVPGLTWKLS